jgi:hypothetical protein
MQPLEQCCVALQAPRQAAKPFASVCNWRAETVPAQSTAITIVAKTVYFIPFLPMIVLLSNYRGRLVARDIRGGLAVGSAAFQLGQIGVIQHSGPNALDLALMINKNGLWGEMKAVTNGCLRVHLNKNGHVPKRMK